MRVRQPTLTLNPARALVTASWITALVLLGFNDHVLKHGELLPQWLTGKLSDFAGLYVAPALLAVLLRVRTRSGLLAAHAATGVVFAAINLDVRAADALVRMVGWVGIDWQIVTDAADLIALPVLVLSYRVLGAAMEQVEPLARLQLLAQRALAATGLLLCMATSDSWDEVIGVSGPHLHNPTRDALIVLLRPLRETFVLDCEAIAEEPGRLLPDDAFEVATAYELKSRANLAVTGSRSDCNATLVSGTELSSVLVYWDSDAGIAGVAPLEYASKKEWQDGAIILHPGEEGLDGYESVGNRDFVFEHAPAREDRDSCVLPDPAQRTVVDGELPLGRRELLAVDVGVDGCLALRLGPDDPLGFDDFDDFDDDEPPVEPSEEDGGVDPGDEDGGAMMSEDDPGMEPPPDPIDDETEGDLPPAVYVCVPPELFPFVPGDMVEIQDLPVGITFSRRSASSLLTRQLLLIPLRADVRIGGLSVAVEPSEDCGFVAQEGCAAIVAPATVDARTATGHVELRPGDPPREVTISPDSLARVAVPFVQWRAGFDDACSAGDSELGADGMLIVLIERGEEEP